MTIGVDSGYSPVYTLQVIIICNYNGEQIGNETE